MRSTCTTLALAAAIAAPAGGQDRPLPDAATFLTNVRAHLRTDRRLLSQYTYLERRREVGLTKLGKVELGPEKVFQVYPGLDPDDTYRRLIEVDGAPRDPKQLQEDDRKREQKVLEQVRKREHESPNERRKREQRAEMDRREEQATLDDLFRIYDFTLVERQSRAGQPMIVVDFTPRSNVVPKTDDGKLMKKIRGRAWVSEADFEVARVEFEMLEDMPVKLFLGKMYKGTTASVERRRINNEVWLPAEARFNASGRALVRKFHVESVVEYSDYKKFSVETDTAFKLPK